MNDLIFWTLVYLTLWAPAFTVMFYAYGGSEKELREKMSALRESQNSLKRLIAQICHPLVDQGMRWVTSFLALCGLLVMKLGGFQ